MHANVKRHRSDERRRLSVVSSDAQGDPHEDTPGPQLIPRILVVDDDLLIGNMLERLYTQSGYSVVCIDSAEGALRRLERGDIDLVVTDVHLGGLSGVDLVGRIRSSWPDVPFIVITGYADVDTAVEVLKLGANDYLVKPFSASVIQESTRAVLKKCWAFTEIRHLRRTLKNQYEFGGMLSRTSEMHRVFETIRMVADTDVTVVIEGETGTGKELVASAIHQQSRRRNGPFIAINCAGIPETLLESELFGCERGAYTGADQSRPGKLELANEGTLFLDEIESMPLPMQAKSLLALQNRKIQRLGGNKITQIDMRVIAASNVPLKNLIAQGQMRLDFYYRINVVPIHLLPLRQRRDDIPLLVQDFLRHHPLALSKAIHSIAPAAMQELQQYAWPGNIRELHNILERAIVFTKGDTVEKLDLPQAEAAPLSESPHSSFSLPFREWLKSQEKYYLIQQLTLAEGRIGIAAKNCGIDTKTLYRKMRFHQLHTQQLKSQQEPPEQCDGVDLNPS
jgi:DNA-binding NtrC family response regulator